MLFLKLVYFIELLFLPCKAEPKQILNPNKVMQIILYREQRIDFIYGLVVCQNQNEH